MNLWARTGIAAAALAGTGAVAGWIARRRDMARAERAYAGLLAAPPLAQGRYDPAQVADLPDVARRFFAHAIAPGTPLPSVVRLTMDGTFLLGERDAFQGYEMTARQALRASDELVWMARMRSGAMTITGSDALVDGEAWTRFWLMGALPVGHAASSPDLVRSALFRAVVESAIWLPGSLLPGNGAQWAQTGQDDAQVTITRVAPAIVIDLRLDEAGAVREIVGQRWSNANADKVFRLQPFGGTASEHRSFQGITVPTEVAVGNHYGTADYLPFFQARITDARYA